MSEEANTGDVQGKAEKALDNVINLYKNETLPKIAFGISILLFTLYLILNLIDINTFIKGLNIMSPDTCTRSTMVFAYIGGYFMLFLKIILALLTMFVMLCIGTVLIVMILGVVKKGGAEQSGGYLNMVGASDSSIYGTIIKWVKRVTQVILGFFTVQEFIITFMVVLPLFMWMALIAISRYYDSKRLINDQDPEKTQNVMSTNHDFIFFFMVSLIVIGMLYIVFNYFSHIPKTSSAISTTSE